MNTHHKPCAIGAMLKSRNVEDQRTELEKGVWKETGNHSAGAGQGRPRGLSLEKGSAKKGISFNFMKVIKFGWEFFVIYKRLDTSQRGDNMG